MSSSVFEPGLLPTEGSERRAVERALEPGSGVQVLLLFGAKGAGMEDWAEYACSRWVFGDGDGVLERCVDFQKIVPTGKSSWHKIGIVREKPTKRVDDFGEEDNEDGESGGGAKKDEFQGIPILKFFRTRPLMGKTKVVWIADADRMNGPTANALLKTFEELPEYGRVVMTTSDFGRVLPTIRSRSLCVACGTPEMEGLDEWERCFAETPGRLRFVREFSEVFEPLYRVMEETLTGDRGRAIALSERARSVALAYDDRAKVGARAAYAEVLELIARWCIVQRPDRPERVQAVAEAYRLVVANGNAGLVFDALFGGLID